MRHAYLIFVWKAEGIADIDLIPVFHNAVQLAADITPRLLNFEEILFELFRVHVLPLSADKQFINPVNRKCDFAYSLVIYDRLGFRAESERNKSF